MHLNERINRNKAGPTLATHEAWRYTWAAVRPLPLLRKDGHPRFAYVCDMFVHPRLICRPCRGFGDLGIIPTADAVG